MLHELTVTVVECFNKLLSLIDPISQLCVQSKLMTRLLC